MYSSGPARFLDGAKKPRVRLGHDFVIAPMNPKYPGPTKVIFKIMHNNCYAFELIVWTHLKSDHRTISSINTGY